MMAGGHSGDDDGNQGKRVLPSWMSGQSEKKRGAKKQADDHEEEIQEAGETNSAELNGKAYEDVDVTKLLEGVVFALSGFVNPERATIRSQALEMGAEYKPDWTSDCTMLICAFQNTPKFKQVKGDGGTIVSKDWILECYNLKKLVDIEPYLMHAGKPWRRNSKLLEIKKGKRSCHSEEPLKQVGKSNAADSNLSHRPESGLPAHLKSHFTPSKIKEWSVDDLNQTMTWLGSQEERPGKNEMKSIAAEGVITCLQDAIESLGKNQDIRHVAEQWRFVPRVVKELIEIESKRKKAHSNKELLELAIKCKEIYEQEYDLVVDKQTKRQKNDCVAEDDAGFDSDDTIVLTEEEISLYSKNLADDCDW